MIIQDIPSVEIVAETTTTFEIQYGAKLCYRGSDSRYQAYLVDNLFLNNHLIYSEDIPISFEYTQIIFSTFPVHEESYGF